MTKIERVRAHMEDPHVYRAVRDGITLTSKLDDFYSVHTLFNDGKSQPEYLFKLVESITEVGINRNDLDYEVVLEDIKQATGIQKDEFLLGFGYTLSFLATAGAIYLGGVHYDDPYSGWLGILGMISACSDNVHELFNNLAIKTLQNKYKKLTAYQTFLETRSTFKQVDSMIGQARPQLLSEIRKLEQKQFLDSRK
jgi:hypothetical protein